MLWLPLLCYYTWINSTFYWTLLLTSFIQAYGRCLCSPCHQRSMRAERYSSLCHVPYFQLAEAITDLLDNLELSFGAWWKHPLTLLFLFEFGSRELTATIRFLELITVIPFQELIHELDTTLTELFQVSWCKCEFALQFVKCLAVILVMVNVVANSPLHSYFSFRTSLVLRLDSEKPP